MDPVEGTHYGRMLTVRNSEFTFLIQQFVYVKGNHQPSFMSHLVDVAVPGLTFFVELQPLAETSFFQRCSNDSSLSNVSATHYMARRQDMLSGVVLLSFGFLGEVNQLCTQFVKI